MNYSLFSNLFQKNRLLIQVFILICLNYLATKFFYSALPLEELYQESSIFGALYKYSSSLLIGFLIAPLFFYKTQWNEIIKQKYILIKYFIFFILSIYAWSVITLDYNLYFDNSYNIDRIILLLLLLLSFRLPMMFIYFLIFSLVFYNQINYPDFGYFFPTIYMNIKPLIEILFLFIVFIFLKKLYKKLSILSFLIALISLHAANYFIPGLGKVSLSEHYIDWIWINNLSNILIAKYSQGWLLDFISIENINLILKWISAFIIPMQLFALTIQLAALFIFIKQRFIIILFITFELLHLGIFLLSGILFWRWILLNIAIIYLINKLTTEDVKKIFNYKIMFFSIPIIFLGNIFFHAYPLAWFDTPLNNFNQIYAVTEDNKKHKIDTNLFAPYERILYLNTLNSFINKPVKARWDTTDSKIMEELHFISNHTEITSLKSTIERFEQQYGANEFNQAEQKKITKFLKIFFSNLNNYKGEKNIWSYLSPIRHIYGSFNWEKPLKEKSKIKAIEIVFSKTFYSHKYNRLIPLEKRMIVKINIL